MSDAHQKLGPGEIYDFEYIPLDEADCGLKSLTAVLNSKVLQPIEVQEVQISPAICSIYQQNLKLCCCLPK
jgi:hypothetical protein